MPKTALEAFNRFQNEQRTIEYVAARPRAGRRHPGADAGGARQIFRGAQGRCSARPNTARSSCSSLTPAELARHDRGLRRRREEAPTRSASARYVTPERRQVQQIVFPNMDEASAAAEQARQGHDVRGARHRARPQGQATSISARSPRPRSSTARSPTPPSRSRPARSARRSRAASARARQRRPRSSPAQTKPFEEVAAELKRELALERAKDEIANAARQDRGRARSAARRSPRPRRSSSLTLRTIEAVDRSGRDPDGKPVADLPQGVDVLAARVRRRRRRRERAAADAGRRLCLVRRRRHHAVARAPARRGQGPGRGALARRRDRRAAEGQGHRDARQAQGRHAFAEVADGRQAQGRDRGRASSAATPPAGLPRAPSTRSSAPPRTRAGSADGASADRADRVPRHRHHGAAASIRTRPTPSASTTRCNRAIAEDLLGAIHRAAAKARSA